MKILPLIKGSADRKYKDASSCLRAMLQYDSNTGFAAMLQWSKDSRTILAGMLVHHCIIMKESHEKDFSLTSLLVHMYLECGSLQDAEAVFRKMYQHCSSLWNALVRAHVKQGDIHGAFEVFDQMLVHNATPSKSTYINLLSLCRSDVYLDKGKRLHGFIRINSLEGDVFLMTALVSMYGNCGCFENARQTFETMQKKDVVAYTIMIGIYTHHGRALEAIELLNTMEEDGLKPDKVTFVSVLDACTSTGLISEGKKMHARIKQYGVELDVVVSSALMNMYGKCGSVENARELFDRIPERNIVSWNTMLSVYARHGLTDDAIKLLDQMQCSKMKPDRVTFVIMVDVCANCALLDEGERIHGLIMNTGHDKHPSLGNALINMYGKCGNLIKARDEFNNLSDRDVISWNTIIAVHAQQGECETALRWLTQMQQEAMVPDSITFISALDACTTCTLLHVGKRLHSIIIKDYLDIDVGVGSALMNMYGRCGDVELARTIHDEMKEKNVISWNTIVSLCSRHGLHDAVFQLFDQMITGGTRPDNVTMSCAVDVCADSCSFAKGQRLHVIILNAGNQSIEPILGTSLVYMYGKCGCLDNIEKVFNQISCRDTISWTTLIAVYAEHGQADKAINLYHDMKSNFSEPDDITLLILLLACSHSGLIEEAIFFLNSMILEYAICPDTDHYVAIIDLLGRAGRLTEVERIICNIPNVSSVWLLSFLASCRYHNDVERGERAAKHISEMAKECASSYITLLNLYTAADM